MEWVLIVVTLTLNGVMVEGAGEFLNHGDCIVAMHEAEIVVNREYEGMLCLHKGEFQIDGGPEPSESSGEQFEPQQLFDFEIEKILEDASETTLNKV